MKRLSTDRCLHCGQTRHAAAKEGAQCETGYWDQDGEWNVTNSWPKHSWPKPAR